MKLTKHIGEVVKIISLLFVALLSVAVVGCNTVSGVGKDIQTVGDTMTHAAKGDR